MSSFQQKYYKTHEKKAGEHGAYPREWKETAPRGARASSGFLDEDFKLRYKHAGRTKGCHDLKNQREDNVSPIKHQQKHCKRRLSRNYGTEMCNKNEKFNRAQQLAEDSPHVKTGQRERADRKSAGQRRLHTWTNGRRAPHPTAARSAFSRARETPRRTDHVSGRRTRKNTPTRAAILQYVLQPQELGHKTTTDGNLRN